MSDPRRHADQRGIIESILRHIPGFKGYLEKEYRRDSDHLARTWLVDRLQASKQGLDDYQRKLVDAVQLDELPQCERLRTRMDGLMNEIRGSVRGYSGFFDFVQVDERMLDEVYDLDMRLMKDVESVVAAIEELPGSTASPSDALAACLDQLQEVERKYKRRSDLLKGLGP